MIVKKLATINARTAVIITILSVLISIAAMSLFGYYQTGYNTDDVAQQTLVQQTVIGDKQPVVATASGYVLKLPYYHAINTLLPNSDKTVFITNFLLLAAGLLLTYTAFLLLYKKKILTFNIVALSAIFILTSILHLSSGASSNPNYRNIEIGMHFVIVAMALIYLVTGRSINIKKPKNLITPALISIALGFFWFSDPMFIYFTGLPLLLLAVYAFFVSNGKDQKQKYILFSAVLALSYIIYKLWIVVFASVFEWSVRPTLGGLIGINEIIPTIQNSWYAILAAASGGIDVSKPSPLTFLEYIRVIFGFLYITIATILSANLVLDQLKQKQKNISHLYIGSFPFIVFGIFFVSGTVVDAGSMRYLLLIPFTFVLALILSYNKARIFVTTAVISLAILVVGIVSHNLLGVSSNITKRANSKTTESKVLAILAEEGVKKGYAASGVAHYYNYKSNTSLNILPTFCNKKKIGIFYTLIDKGQLVKKSSKSFYLQYPGAISNKCQQEDIERYLKNPYKKIEGPNGITIYLYDRDLRYDFLKK